jgi:SHS2 domain-containing protein
MNGGFSILEHPSDIGIEVTGNSLAEVFRNAASGLMSVIIEPGPVVPDESREITLSAVDTGMLLVRWLSEILYLFDGQGFVPAEFRMDEVTETTLRAVIRGEMLDTARHSMRQDVKAVTYHQLAITKEPAGITARFFLDI